jgi:hypothetical protein
MSSLQDLFLIDDLQAMSEKLGVKGNKVITVAGVC